MSARRDRFLPCHAVGLLAGALDWWGVASSVVHLSRALAVWIPRVFTRTSSS